MYKTCKSIGTHQCIKIKSESYTASLLNLHTTKSFTPSSIRQSFFQTRLRLHHQPNGIFQTNHAGGSDPAPRIGHLNGPHRQGAMGNNQNTEPERADARSIYKHYTETGLCGSTISGQNPSQIRIIRFISSLFVERPPPRARANFGRLGDLSFILWRIDSLAICNVLELDVLCVECAYASCILSMLYRYMWILCTWCTT